MKLLLAFFLAAISCASHGQGSIIFRNFALIDPRADQPYDALATYSNGARIGPEFSGGLYLVSGPAESLVGVTRFRMSRPGTLDPIQFIIPGIRPGEPATFRVKAWETAAGSYENAVQNGFCAGIFPTISGDDQVTVLLGDPLTPLPVLPATLNGLLPLQLTCVPEPGAISIAALGFGFVYFRTRRLRRPLE